MSLNSNNRKFTISTTDTSKVGTYDISITATDNAGITATTSFHLYTKYLGQSITPSSVTPTETVYYNKTNYAPKFKTIPKNIYITEGYV